MSSRGSVKTHVGLQHDLRMLWKSLVGTQLRNARKASYTCRSQPFASKFVLSMTQPKCFGQLVLILILGLSLGLRTSTAASGPLLRGSVDCPAQKSRTGNSPTPAGGDQAKARPDLIIVQAPVVRPGDLSQRFPKGSRLVRLAPSDPTPHILTPDFFAAADPRTSFDGARVLFAGKKTSESPWQIWEMNVDGSGARQVTQCSGDCLKPAYLPRGLIVFTALAEGPAERPGSSSKAQGSAPSAAHAAGRQCEGSQLWVSKLDGSDAHPITFGPGDFQVETVLKNGMILATARSPLLPSNGLPADRELYTMRPRRHRCWPPCAATISTPPFAARRKNSTTARWSL